jgi:hypothetical protein
VTKKPAARKTTTRKTTTKKTTTKKTTLEKTINRAADSFGRELGRQIVRGLFSTFMK